MNIKIMQNIWRKSMISAGFKKQLIINYYNTQLLPLSDEIRDGFVDTIKRIKNNFLFRIDYSFDKDKSEYLWVNYKYKDNNIDYDIYLVLIYLITTIHLIHEYSEYEKFKIQERILDNIKNISNEKQDIEDRLDYVKYMEDVYD